MVNPSGDEKFLMSLFFTAVFTGIAYDIYTRNEKFFKDSFKKVTGMLK